MIAAPPLLDGADQLSATCPFPGVALKFCGAVGTVIDPGVVKVIDSLCPIPGLFPATALAIYTVFGSSPMIVVLNGLAVVFTNTSRKVVSVTLRIQNPREVIEEPPVFVIFPVSTTVVLVTVPKEIVSEGNVEGVADTLAWAPSPAELLARTLKV